MRKGTAALAKRQVRPFSPAGFDEAFVEFGADAADCPEPPVDEVMPSMAGCEILGPPPTL
jgi:hypothetical protein